MRKLISIDDIDCTDAVKCLVASSEYTCAIICESHAHGVHTIVPLLRSALPADFVYSPIKGEFRNDNRRILLCSRDAVETLRGLTFGALMMPADVSISEPLMLQSVRTVIRYSA